MELPTATQGRSMPRRLLSVPPVLLLCAAALAAAARAPGDCRCRAPQPCIVAVPWHELNASLPTGVLMPVRDELDACLAKGAGSTECAADLDRTDDE